jgi:hypothetical protein
MGLSAFAKSKPFPTVDTFNIEAPGGLDRFWKDKNTGEDFLSPIDYRYTLPAT